MLGHIEFFGASGHWGSSDDLQLDQEMDSYLPSTAMRLLLELSSAGQTYVARTLTVLHFMEYGGPL